MGCWSFYFQNGKVYHVRGLSLADAKRSLAKSLNLSRLPNGTRSEESDPIGQPAIDRSADAPRTKIKFRDLSDTELCEFLLANPTVSDKSWTDQTRYPGEKREAFVKRICMVYAPSGTDEHDAAVASGR